jgi:hypothetical protein
VSKAPSSNEHALPPRLREAMGRPTSNSRVSCRPLSGVQGVKHNEAAPNRANPFSGISDVEPRNHGHSENGARGPKAKVAPRDVRFRLDDLAIPTVHKHI